MKKLTLFKLIILFLATTFESDSPPGWFGQVDVWFDKLVVDNDIADRLLVGGYDEYIKDETTLSNLYITAILVKENNFYKSNYPSVNYVMNVMYNKLQNQAVPFSLK